MKKHYTPHECAKPVRLASFEEFGKQSLQLINPPTWHERKSSLTVQVIRHMSDCEPNMCAVVEQLYDASLPFLQI